MKVLILGATGMAGHLISIYFQERGHDVTNFSTRPFIHGENIVGDAADQSFFSKVLTGGNYDVVINCIGILNTDCDRDRSKAVYLNSYLPHFISNTLKSSNTKLIHMSTDCVFSGKTGEYNEGSFPDGETFYDRSKALGEIDDSKNLTFRNSIIGPDMNVNGIGLFNWFMKQSGPLKGYSKAMWTGVTTLTLAKAMESAVNENLTGIYHLVNNDIINKFEMLRLFNRYFKDDFLHIEPNGLVDINKSLVNNRADFSFKVPSYEQMIGEMKKWIFDHQKLYPHYFN